MILGTHVIFCAYGFWLPNDPRGSWSDFVGSWELLKFGRATTVNVRQSLAAVEHDRHARQEAKKALKHPPVLFTGRQAQAIGLAFKDLFHRWQVPVWACSILPDHVHLVVGRFDGTVERLVNHLKGSATRRLRAAGMHPCEHLMRQSGTMPKAFARGQWKVFLDCPADVIRSVRYVEANPEKEGKARQRWSFVEPLPFPV